MVFFHSRLRYFFEYDYLVRDRERYGFEEGDSVVECVCMEYTVVRLCTLECGMFPHFRVFPYQSIFNSR